ncbi:MAG: RNA methyltransferase [Gemmatimonadales bacterium]|nr:MAG: RNA methyltransferase [Gemmatimonadales bacterium]
MNEAEGETRDGMDEMAGSPDTGNLVVVLDEPQNLVNIAGVIRAMKNMGLRSLRVVNPAEWDAWRITGIAHRSDDVVESARHFTSLQEALSDCVMVVGTSARPRAAQRNYGWAREWAPRLLDAARTGPAAILFGREDRGLSNEALDLCDGVAIIPTDPDYSSLNLAQACLILCYELFLSSGEGDPDELPRGKRWAGNATRDEMEQMFQALEGGLARIDFFNARSPEAVMRTFRTLLARAGPDRQEAGLVAAVGFEIQKYLARALQQ